jgi:hypothetical protein
MGLLTGLTGLDIDALVKSLADVSPIFARLTPGQKSLVVYLTYIQLADGHRHYSFPSANPLFHQDVRRAFREFKHSESFNADTS